MLSLIICSRTPRISEELEKNIAETIGCVYELVVIDNSKNNYSIFSAYNEGIRRAKGNNLCFMHDDITFHTKDWGIMVEGQLINSDIGCIGTIGAYVMGDFAYWDFMQPYVTGMVRSDEKGLTGHNCNLYYDETQTNEVAVVDGMWFCIPKALFGEICFDDKSFTNFHWYDMDICMQILTKGKKIIVNRDIVIYHYCHPQYNLSFLTNMKIFKTKWQDRLPVSRGVSVNPQVLLAIKGHANRYYNELFQKLNCENCISMKLGQLILKPLKWFKTIFSK